MQILWGKVFTSKTFWLGVLMILAAIVEYVFGLPAGTSWVQALSGILAIIIRFLTNDALVQKPPAKKGR